MADEKKDEFQTFTSPEGVALFTNLQVPRDYKGDGKFKYDTNLVCDASAEVQEFCELIDKWVEESAAKHEKPAGKPSYGPHKDKDGNGVPGKVQFKFTVQAVTKTKKGPWDRKPTLFDADGNVVPDMAIIGAGSRIVVNYQRFLWANPFVASVSLQPVEVQVLDLVVGGPGGGGQHTGFAARAGSTAGGNAPRAPEDHEPAYDPSPDSAGATGDF